MLFPELSEFSTETNNTQNGIDFLFIDGQHKIKSNGELEECSQTEALGRWIAKTVTTAQNTYEVYTKGESTVFGTNIEDHLGIKNRSYWLSELQREITEQLLSNSFINNVSNYNAMFNGREVYISFTVATTDGLAIEYNNRI